MSLQTPSTRPRTIDGVFVPTHGASKTALYGIWQHAKARCHNPTDGAYPKYGGRGLVMCERWRHSFEAFAKDMGPRPSAKHSIERKDNDGGYCPENCVWATKSEQANNRKSSRIIDVDGHRKTAMQWSRETGIHESLIRARIDRLGWTPKDAVTRKVGLGVFAI
jgi:hypothetical protein